MLHRVWTPRRQVPIAPVQPRYAWLYVVGFVQPETGATFWLLLPRINTTLYSLALAEFAQAVGAGTARHIVLVIDQAGWHQSRHRQVPAGITLIPLPAYSPELQPAERLWTLVDEVVANQVVPTLDDLVERLSERCRTLRTMATLIARRTTFHWWPRLASTKE